MYETNYIPSSHAFDHPHAVLGEDFSKKFSFEVPVTASGTSFIVSHLELPRKITCCYVGLKSKWYYSRLFDALPFDFIYHHTAGASIAS